MSLARTVALVSSLFAPLSVAVGQPCTQVPSISVHHQDGQTFLTWTELTPDVTYHVYRHTSQITGDNIGVLTPLQWSGSAIEIPIESGLMYTELYKQGGWTFRHTDRMWIPGAGGTVAKVPPGTGVFVYTTDESGSYHYAVTAVHPTGECLSIGANATAVAIVETVADPRPILVPSGTACSEPSIHVFQQIMDPLTWNITAHAPNERNKHYGYSSGSTQIDKAIQYAYTYEVAYPPTAEGCAVPPTGYPLTLVLHGRAAGQPQPKCQLPGDEVSAGSLARCGVEIRPFDVGNSWWYGFAKEYDYRTWTSGTAPPATATERIVNFTEQRLLRMVYDTWRDPSLASIDLNRVYVRGFSMGGSGALAVATRYPNVFAAAHSSHGMTSYANYMVLNQSGDPCSAFACPWFRASFQEEFTAQWGDPASPILAAFAFPDFTDLPAGPGWEVPVLGHSDSFTIWEWQNHQSQFAAAVPPFSARLLDDMVPVGMTHGFRDSLIPYCNQPYDAYPVVAAGSHCVGMEYDNSGHTGTGLDIGMPIAMAEIDETPFFGFGVVKNETVPGFSDDGFAADLEAPCSTGISGAQRFTDIEWAASWNYPSFSFAQPPYEDSTTWKMWFRTTSSSAVTVDVTPRRLQILQPSNDAAVYAWMNCRYAQGSPPDCPYEWGQVTVLPGELLTIPDVEITPGWEHELVIMKQ